MEAIEEKSNFKKYGFIFLLLLGHIYLWPKLIDYLDLFSYSGNVIDTLRLSINIPIYLASFALLTRLRLYGRVFFKVWICLAVIDELLMIVDDFGMFGIGWEIENILTLPPLYFMGYLYAFRSNELWENTQPFKFNFNT